jgi:hypothetical protein
LISIYENYKNYTPAKTVRRTIERLLSSVPTGHLAGLASVVLTNSQALGKGKTKRIRGRKYPENTCLGFYHAASQNSGAWIEVVIDNVTNTAPEICLRWKFLSDLIFSETLFHEIGHHLDATIGSPARTGEAAADEWSRRLRKRHFRRRYWYLLPLLRLASTILKPRIKEALAEARATEKMAG